MSRGRRLALPRMPRATRRRGFSLLEVLAAFVILALVATALFQMFSGALTNAAAADDWSRAVLFAESRLSLAANAEPLVESDDGGNEEGGLRWESRVRALETPPPEIIESEMAPAEGEPGALVDNRPTRLYRIEVDVHFPGLAGKERAFSLATVRLAARDPQ